MNETWRLLSHDGVEAAAGLALDEALLAGYSRPGARGVPDMAADPGREPTLRLYTYRSHCDAELIIACNTDAAAPIFDVAHYGTTIDLFDLVAALTDKLGGCGRRSTWTARSALSTARPGHCTPTWASTTRRRCVSRNGEGGRSTRSPAPCAATATSARSSPGAGIPASSTSSRPRSGEHEGLEPAPEAEAPAAAGPPGAARRAERARSRAARAASPAPGAAAASTSFSPKMKSRSGPRRRPHR
jgi:hypothetical protein